MDSGWDDGHREGVSNAQSGRPSDNSCPRNFSDNIAYCTAWDGYHAGKTVGEADSGNNN